MNQPTSTNKQIQKLVKDAKELSRRGNPEDAHDKLNEAEAIAEAIDLKVRIFVTRASVFRATGDLDQALTVIAQALGLDPPNPAALVCKGQIFEQKEDFLGAYGCYSSVLSANPQDKYAKQAMVLLKTKVPIIKTKTQELINEQRHDQALNNVKFLLQITQINEQVLSLLAQCVNEEHEIWSLVRLVVQDVDDGSEILERVLSSQYHPGQPIIAEAVARIERLPQLPGGPPKSPPTVWGQGMCLTPIDRVAQRVVGTARD